MTNNFQKSIFSCADLAELLKNGGKYDRLIFIETEDEEDTDIKIKHKTVINTEKEMAEEDLEESLSELIQTDPSEALYVTSQKGKIILQYNNFRYRKVYHSKNGSRWSCSMNKDCTAFLYVNDNDEITMANENHCHTESKRDTSIVSERDTAVIITSRKGKEMLLYKQYTYRKQYVTNGKARWCCSTLKNCRANVFTDVNNSIITAFEDHNHDPPKYYRKPKHVLKAIREPLIIETD